MPGAAADTADSRKAFLGSERAFAEEVDDLAALRLTAGQSDLIGRARAEFARFMTLDGKIIADYRSRTAAGRRQADNLVTHEEITIFNRISAVVDELVTTGDRQAGAAERQAATVTVRARQVLIGLAVVALPPASG